MGNLDYIFDYVLQEFGVTLYPDHHDTPIEHLRRGDIVTDTVFNISTPALVVRREVAYTADHSLETRKTVKVVTIIDTNGKEHALFAGMRVAAIRRNT